jgi:SAM-dependent methyltransferase
MAAAIRRKQGGCSVADVGCGYPTKLARLICPLTESLTVFDQASVEALIQSDFPELDFVPIDLETPGEPPARFDFVVCADVVEHLLDPNPLLAFLSRLVAPDGLLFLSTPEREIIRGEDCLSSPNREHVREWNATEFRAYAESRGLRVHEQTLLPVARVSFLENFLLKQLRHLRLPRYSGCQMLVCSGDV